MAWQDNRCHGRTIALLTEYDGHGFSGWQIQAGQRSVQQVMRETIIKLTDEPDLVLTGCSRTDAGVHARAHVSSFTTTSRIPADRWPLALNSLLPDDIAVKAATETADGFNARYAARGKIYTYRIWNHPIRPVLDRYRYCHVPSRLDLDALIRAMPVLIGRHDFMAFRDAGSSCKTTARTLQRIRLVAHGPSLTLLFQGDGFLYHMVRILAGTLLAVALGKIAPDQVDAVLASRDRRLAGKTMPPEGLCLEHVYYQPELFGPWQEMTAEDGDLDVQYALE